MSEWQKCPICQGVGQVSGGFYDRADCNSWMTDHTVEICRTCQGKGIIVQPEPPKERGGLSAAP